MSAGAARPAYRPDIDGLRAVAVVSVVLAHAGAPGVAGGFLGVDVFFVISGFLITRILADEINRGGIRFARFYERRVRRILPALVLVLACCTPFAVWLMLPEFLENFGQEMFATVAFSNNLKLALTADYWDLQSTQKPLLHTWSLGVEEQFYLVFPAVLALAARYGSRGQVVAVVAIGLVSFALAEITQRLLGPINFFLPTSRAWELMAGAVAAYIPRRPRRFDQPVALACLVAVILPMGVFGTAPTPTVWSLPSVLGTAGLLAFGRPELLAGRVLSIRPFVFVGLISYSAYLWHQPLFAFARIASLQPPSPELMTGLTLLTFLLAAISWKFVEQPFRDPALPFRRLVVPVLVPASALAALGLVFHFNAGFPRWTYPNMQSEADVRADYVERVFELGAGGFPDNGKANVLVVGNSFARDAANVLIESGAVRDKNLRYVGELGYCQLALSARTREMLPAADILVVAASVAAADCIDDVRGRLEGLSNVPVVVFGDKYFGESINPYARVAMEERARTYADAGAAVADANDRVRAALPPDGFVDLLRALGPDGRRVRYFDDEGNPITMDRLHFTRYGAQFVGRRLVDSGSPGLARIANATPRPR
jgi:peptidoglycan/LPS O-acetylase OafA/YrhL